MRIPHKGDYAYHQNTGLQQKIKHLEAKVENLSNGKELQKAKKNADKWRQKYEREHALRKKDALRQKKEADRRLRLFQDAAQDVQDDLDKALEKIEKLEGELREAKEELKKLDEARETIKVLRHRLGLDHTSSHNPSSRDPIGAKKKRHTNNSRKKTGAKPGAQPGHNHHPRKQLDATTDPVWHEGRPPGTENEDGWYMTDRWVEKKEVAVRVIVEVIPHRSRKWRNKYTGAERVSPFPPGIVNEINYGVTTAAMTMMLTQFGNVADRKAKQIIRELTNGAVDPSHGWIHGLAHKFAQRSQKEILEIFEALFNADYMNVDGTTTKVNGKNRAIHVACNEAEKLVLYIYTRNKGKEAARMLPCALELAYQGTVISDREAALIVLGLLHQICIAHVERDLQNIIDFEKDRKWHKKMKAFLQKLVHASHEWKEHDDGPSAEQVKEWEDNYDQILADGKKEYCTNPPSKEFLKGYNLRATLEELKPMVLLFVHDPSIPATNNFAERCARVHKRALHQAVTYRADEAVDDWCALMSIVQTRYLRGENIYDIFLDVMARPINCSEESVPAPATENN